MQYNPKHYTLDMLSEHRQQFIDLRIQRLCRDYGINTWPVDCGELIATIRDQELITFNYDFVPVIDQKFDAEARYYPDDNLYIILINRNHARESYPYKCSKDGRLNFTLAHELGHIFLDHLSIPDHFKTTHQKKIEHEEAHEFAGRLLMPKDRLLSCTFTSSEKVAAEFKVTTQAIRKRLDNLKRLDLFEA